MKRNLHLIIFFTISFASLAFAQTAITITEARAIDAEGALILQDESIILEGKVIGPNFRPGGQTFILFDVQADIGITVFSIDTDLGYSATDNDNIRVTGSLTQFNGLAEIEPTSIEILAPGGPNPSVIATTTLGENTESKLVRYENATLVDPSQWENSGSFNVDVTNGTTTIQVRIDSDTDISGRSVPMGTFDITGIGGQFDGETPFDSGYQLFPRSSDDIDPFDDGSGGGGDPNYTVVTLEALRNNTAEGTPSMEGETVEVSATVYGVNLRDNGLQFTVINDNNVGVSIFNNEFDFGYAVNEGDGVTVQGTVAHFNGLTQVVADSVWRISENNRLVSPRAVTQLDESTESSLIEFNVSDVTDPAAWAGDGSSFNIEFLDSSNNPFTVRIDNNTFWANQAYPSPVGLICRGIGGQFDGSSPHDEGYQILPRYEADLFDIFLSTYNLTDITVSIYPIPADNFLRVSADNRISGITVHDLSGTALLHSQETQLDISSLGSGAYILQVQTEKGTAFRKLVKN